MKKLFSILLTLCVMVSACSVLAEEDTDYTALYPESLIFESDWASGGTLMQIYCEDDGYRVMISQRTGEMLDEHMVWEYSPLYDQETGTLQALAFGKKYHIYPEGENERWETEYEDGEASFAIQESGKLIWKDEKEEAGADMEFVKIGRFAGNYVCDRGNIEILWDSETVYSIDVHLADSAFVSNDWSYKATYHPDTDTLEASGMASITTYDENEEFVSVEFLHEEEGAFATFSFNEDNLLIWESSDGAGDGLLFENLLYTEDDG